jgi:hypothetical protein
VADIINFPGTTQGRVPPRKILEKILQDMDAMPLRDVIVITVNTEDVIHLHTSSGENPDILWTMKMAERILFGDDQPGADDE